MKHFFLSLFLLVSFAVFAQQGYWQQKIKYVMDVNLNVTTNILKGTQTITYTNNSPDTLNRIFIHLFWNAFQPNSMMDVNSRSSESILIGRTRNGSPANDYDRRFHHRIIDLKPEEQGYCNVVKFIYNGKEQKTKLHETILEVILDKAILPKASAVFTTEFESKVPKLARRSGRDNPEGVRYSMGQWYPKISEYDVEGWHPDDYVRGEFYGVWGDYDVNITLDKNYKLGGTGILQNASAIGWGYDKEGTPLKPVTNATRTWKFSAKSVHDFAWTADPTYKHFTRQIPNGPLLHFIYKEDSKTEAGWQATADSCVIIYSYMAKVFGAYAYPVYSFLQGSGGGTEYPMATMVRNSSFETAVHEWCHSWYQMMLGTNENLHGWMDEGFTDYMEARVLAWLRKKDFFEDAAEYDQYYFLARSAFDEPMSTHANYYRTNLAYNTNSYYKGAVFLRQLGYIVGEENIDKILMRYYQQWRFKHPTPNDFIRVAEKTSGMQLQWYLNYMMNTTKIVNYGIDSLWEAGGATKVRLKNEGQMPMPIEVKVTFKDGSSEWHYVPLSLQFGEKPADSFQTSRTVYSEWKWTHPIYEITTKKRLTEIVSVEIDPTGRLADIDRKDNRLELKW
jgi:hypothetical protein